MFVKVDKLFKWVKDFIPGVLRKFFFADPKGAKSGTEIL